MTDGTHWLVKQGLADAERMCIAGGSYGGYTALMGAAKEPDLYRCAVSLNGVSDLPALLRHSLRFVSGRFATRFIGSLWRDRKALHTNSPINRADDIRIPVLLAHGSDDRVVKVRQSRAMSRALTKADVQHTLPGTCRRRPLSFPGRKPPGVRASHRRIPDRTPGFVNQPLRAEKAHITSGLSLRAYALRTFNTSSSSTIICRTRILN